MVQRLSDQLILQKPGKTGAVPSSPEEYKTAADKKKWPDVMTLLQPGTKLKVHNIQLEKNFEAGNIVWVKALILDGDLAGKPVELLFISKKIAQKDPPASIATIDPSYLEPIED